MSTMLAHFNRKKGFSVKIVKKFGSGLNSLRCRMSSQVFLDSDNSFSSALKLNGTQSMRIWYFLRKQLRPRFSSFLFNSFSKCTDTYWENLEWQADRKRLATGLEPRTSPLEANCANCKASSQEGSNPLGFELAPFKVAIESCPLKSTLFLPVMLIEHELFCYFWYFFHSG